MPSEPEWSKQISGESFCTWFYALALINLFFGLAGVLAALYAMSRGRGSVSGFILTVIFISIGLTNAWAFFVMCNRSIGSNETR